MLKTQCIRLRASSHRIMEGGTAPSALDFSFGLKVNERLPLILFCTRSIIAAMLADSNKIFRFNLSNFVWYVFEIVRVSILEETFPR